MVFLAKTAGFCRGVQAAVGRLEQLVESGEAVCTLGEIIHNKNMVNHFEQHGVKVIESVDEANGRTVVIRAHGVPPSIYNELNECGIPFVDCTCVDVAHIHGKVAAAYEDGCQIILAGDSTHAEIIGTNGFAGNSAIIVSNEADITTKMFEDGKKYALFAQTTFDSETFERIADKVRRIHLNCVTHNTICPATRVRQAEADALSKKVDAMFVVGSCSSANTKALFEICKKNLENTFFIENLSCIEEYVLKYLISSVKMIGITAGASTPPAIIKEVYDHMSEIKVTPEENMEQSFEAMLNEQTNVVKNGEVVKGKVISVQNNEITLNLGYKSDGLIEKGHYSNDPDANVAELVKPGDEIEAVVVRVNDGEGVVHLSRKIFLARKGFLEIEEAFANGTIVSGKITAVTKGGYHANINGVTAFVPASQVSNRFIKDSESMVGQEFNFNVTKIEKGKRVGVVAGRKELAAKEEAEKREKVFANLEVGGQAKGKVQRITTFGAFVDLGGVDGLIHVSELSYGRIKAVTDVLSEGEEIVVTVKSIDTESGKISLTYKDKARDPWNNIEEKYPLYAVVEGKVVRFAKFGVFVELEEGVEGLVHISHIAYERITKPEAVLTLEQTVEVRVMGVDPEARKIGLSIKEVFEPPMPEEQIAEAVEEPVAEAAEEPATETE